MISQLLICLATKDLHSDKMALQFDLKRVREIVLCLSVERRNYITINES
jgi:hypothetical protein